MVCLIVVGLATFMNAETRSSEDSATPFSLLGVACISMALVVDAAIINIQVRTAQQFCTPEQASCWLVRNRPFALPDIDVGWALTTTLG